MERQQDTNINRKHVGGQRVPSLNGLPSKCTKEVVLLETSQLLIMPLSMLISNIYSQMNTCLRSPTHVDTLAHTQDNNQIDAS